MHKLYEILTKTPWIDTCSNLSTNRQEITGDTGILFITLNYSLTQTAIRSTELITNHLSILRKKNPNPQEGKNFSFQFLHGVGNGNLLGRAGETIWFPVLFSIRRILTILHPQRARDGETWEHLFWSFSSFSHRVGNW